MMNYNNSLKLNRRQSDLIFAIDGDLAPMLFIYLKMIVKEKFNIM
jgi:hypothetical protein